MSALEVSERGLTLIESRAASAEEDARDELATAYAQGVADLARLLMANPALEFSGDDMMSMRATNGQLADIIWPRR